MATAANTSFQGSGRPVKPSSSRQFSTVKSRLTQLLLNSAGRNVERPCPASPATGPSAEKSAWTSCSLPMLDRRAPLVLSDSELDAVFAAARPLDVDRRDAFLQAVAAALAGKVIGPGTVYQAVRECQLRFFDAPD